MEDVHAEAQFRQLPNQAGFCCFCSAHVLHQREHGNAIQRRGDGEGLADKIQQSAFLHQLILEPGDGDDDYHG